MKPKILAAFAVLAGILLISCQKEKNGSLGNGDLSIGFAQTNSLKSFKNVDAIIVSIETEKGEPILSNHKIPLFNLNGNYIGESIKLATGTYRITSFLIVDDSSNVVYLTPKESSEYAAWVKDPLPIPFTINSEETTEVMPEVVDPEDCNCSPSKFGYSLFSFNVVKPNCNEDSLICLNINIIDEKNFDLFSCFIHYDDNTRDEFKLKAGINFLDIKNKGEKINIDIVPAANCLCGSFHLYISLSDIANQYSCSMDSPLKVVMQINPIIVDTLPRFIIIDQHINYAWGYMHSGSITTSDGIQKHFNASDTKINFQQLNNKTILADSLLILFNTMEYVGTAPFQNISKAIELLPKLKEDLVSESNGLFDYGFNTTSALVLTGSIYKRIDIVGFGDTKKFKNQDEATIMFCEYLNIPITYPKLFPFQGIE